MSSTLLGACAALVASALFSAGLVIQATETREVESQLSLKAALVTRLLRRPRFVVGTLILLVGYPFHVVALLLAPLTVVQPALAAGLLVLLAVGARTAGEYVGGRTVLGVAGIVVGVAAMTLSAPDRSEVETETGVLVVALAVLAAVTLVPFVLGRLRAAALPALAMPAAVAAGTAYAFAGISTKLVSDHLSDGSLAATAGWLAVTALVGGLGLLGQLTALQYRPATQVGPVVYVVPVLVPVLLAPFLTGEHWADTPLGGAVTLASLLVVCLGTALVSASTAASRAASL